MNERPAPADDDARRWACATLGVAADAEPDAIRAAFLKQVGKADFFPAPDSVVAWHTLTGDPSPRAARVVSARVNAALRSEVEEFAAQFFTIEVGQRVQQWFALNGRCQSSAALVARLDGLSAGLHIDRAALLAAAPAVPGDTATDADDAAPCERAVAEKMLELFVLRPIDRAERQQELMQAWQTQLQAWQTATRQFKKQFPKIAELDPEFIDTVLDTHKPVRRALAAVAERPVAASGSSGTTGKGRSWPLSVAVFLVLMFVSSISRCVRDQPPVSPLKKKPSMQDNRRQLQQQPLVPPSRLHPIDPRRPIDVPPLKFQQSKIANLETLGQNRDPGAKDTVASRRGRNPSTQNRLRTSNPF